MNLNAPKATILHSNLEDNDFDLDFIDISGDFVKILHDDKFHKYLGRYISLSKEGRIQCEFKHRKQIGWYAFQKHQKCILNRHISLQRRLHYFDVCVTPAILFGLPVFPLLRSQLRDLDIVQRKMLRRVIGWRTLPGESWRDTMKRMTDQRRAETLYFCES